MTEKSVFWILLCANLVLMTIGVDSYVDYSGGKHVKPGCFVIGQSSNGGFLIPFVYLNCD